jgi:N,N'-diacetyllegionaminate synthase
MKTLIIAEAGVNHNGDINLAKRLVDVAFEAGADYVKFQSFKASELVSKKAEKAEYQLKTTDSSESQFEMIKKLELSEEDHLELLNYCKEVGIGFASSPFDINGIKYLEELNLDFIKVPSGEITNLPYLRELSKTTKRIILSSGMSELQEIKDALSILNSRNVVVLHCNTEYPTPYEDVNLNAMLTIKRECDVEVGYSDHSLGVEVPIAAVAMGARVVEKHFTLDKTMNGPDHQASLDPEELKQMISAIRNIERAMGSGEKTPSASEIKNIPIARKSIVASRAILKGEVFSVDNIIAKRPGSGLSPMMWDEVIGKHAVKDFEEDELIFL